MDIPTVHEVWGITRDEGGDFERIIQYGGIRYHLLLRWNNAEGDCVENAALRKVYDAVEEEDTVRVDEAAGECIDLIWPFVVDDYNTRKESDETIKLRAVTENAVLRVVKHDVRLQYEPPVAVENAFPSLPTVSSTEVEILDKIEGSIYKVRTIEGVYCMKSVRGMSDSANFVREITILEQCCHPNIIRLIGLVVDKQKKVESMLMEYINNARSLRDVESVSIEECAKWIIELHSAISYLHENELVWGDSKASNILIREGSIILIDFGGGYTKNWVDKENYETKKGDWQGYDRIVNFLQNKVNIRMNAK